MVRVFAFPETPNSTIGYSGAASYLYSLRLVPATDFIEHYLPLHDHSAKSQSPSETPIPLSSTVPFGWSIPATTEVRFAPATIISPRTAFVTNKVGWQWLPPFKTQLQSSRLEPHAESLDQGDERQAESIPFCYSGHLYSEGETDTIRFKVKEGKRYRAFVNSKHMGYPIDTAITILHAETREIIAKNDDQSRNDYDSAITFNAKEETVFEAQVTDAVDSFSPHHAYSLILEEVVPNYTLTVPAQRYSIEAGKPLEIVVTVNRTDGFDKAIKVSLEPLADLKANESISAESVTSEAKGETSKSVKLVINTSEKANYQGYLQITGNVIVDGETANPKISATFALRPEIMLNQQWLNVRSPE